jgi:uncharacterized membrane protein
MCVCVCVHAHMQVVYFLFIYLVKKIYNVVEPGLKGAVCCTAAWCYMFGACMIVVVVG